MPWSAFLRRRASLVVLAAVLVVAVLLIAAQLALRRLPALVADALGPRASVGAIEPGWRGVVVRDLVIAADRARWPAADELRADRVTIVPQWRSLFGGAWRVARLEVEGGYVSMLRTREGRLAVVPSFTTSRSPPRAGAAPSVRLDAVTVQGVTLDLFDATVPTERGAPHRIRLTGLKAQLAPVSLPAMDERMAVDIDATVKGVQGDGRLAVDGHVTPATRDATLRVRAQDIDLVALQPYLLRHGEASVQRGSLDLVLDAKAAQQRLHAPGRLTLRDLQLDSSGGVLATFAGVPRQAVLAAIARDGRIELEFTLDGRVDDPQFSLNEVFAARFAVGLAEKLGVSLGGVVEGVGNVIKGLFGR
jgi:uncharacterized protein YjhX (UPF0386 family)